MILKGKNIIILIGLCLILANMSVNGMSKNFPIIDSQLIELFDSNQRSGEIQFDLWTFGDEIEITQTTDLELLCQTKHYILAPDYHHIKLSILNFKSIKAYKNRGLFYHFYFPRLLDFRS